MANTTFEGPVRSKNGFVDVDVNATTGVETEYTNSTTTMTAGTGITTGTGTVYTATVSRQGSFIITRIFVDLTGLSSSAAGDIIGVEATANCHFGQITAAVNGTIISGSITCVEVPTTGEPDIDVYCATEATGTEDAAITSLAETALQAAGADYAAIGTTNAFTALPAADQYLYLVGSGAGTDAVYDAGQFIIELYGTAA